jgi:GH24 family phage-related lysozyme (muramidase)
MKYEGLRLHAYIGPDGKRYNGYGYRTNSLKKITKLQAMKQLQKRVERAERCVNNANLNLNQYQFDALVSLTDNMGNLPKAVIKAINEKQDITKVFAKYNHCKHNGKLITLRGLTKRRAVEAGWYSFGSFVCLI